jgi:hypothetical protein
MFGRFINPPATVVNDQYVDWLGGEPDCGADTVANTVTKCGKMVVETQSGKTFAVPEVDPIRFLGGVMQRQPKKYDVG